jgi:uncharacterized membrane protein YccF (DUF307 family)
MNQPYAPAPFGSPAPDLSKSEEDQLDLLGILFYVYAGLVGVSSMVCLGLGIAGLAIAPMAGRPTGRHDPDPAMFGVALLVVLGAVALFLAAKAVLLILAGRAVRARSGYVTPMIAACLSIINMPIGTALGVFALITLSKPAVKARLSS